MHLILQLIDIPFQTTHINISVACIKKLSWTITPTTWNMWQRCVCINCGWLILIYMYTVFILIGAHTLDGSIFSLQKTLWCSEACDKDVYVSIVVDLYYVCILCLMLIEACALTEAHGHSFSGEKVANVVSCSETMKCKASHTIITIRVLLHLYVH